MKLDNSILSGKRKLAKKVNVVVLGSKEKKLATKGQKGWKKQSETHGRVINDIQKDNSAYRYDHPLTPHEHDMPEGA